MSKKAFVIFLTVVLLLALSASVAYADKPVGFDPNGNETKWESSSSSCTKISSGLIVDSAGDPVGMGYDQYGYNYQAHMFNGTYDSSDRNLDGTYWGDTGDYVDDKLMMKWSDEWLANVDCDEDGKLDRGLVNGDVGGTSLGWLTNHVEGDYIDVDGTQHYTYFVKIGYVGSGGPLWGAYDIFEEVYNDPATGYHGVQVLTDPGLGQFLEK